jgi:TRAP-type C4-dicarboxylate transport system substrate-binding protein
LKNRNSVMAIIAIIVIGLFLFSACSTTGNVNGNNEENEVSNTADKGQVYRFSFASETPEGHPITVNFIDNWIESVEEATDGRVLFTKHLGGSLVEGGSMLQGVSSGLADAGWCPLSYFPGEAPLYNALCVTGYDWISGRLAANVNKDFMEAFSEGRPEGIEIMWTHAPAPGCFLTNKPINTLEDLAGLQIRCDTVHNDGVAALGATPVAMTMPEAYEALSKSIIDGVLGNTEPLVGWNLYEITDYIVEAPMLYNTPPVAIFNSDSWNSLPQDLQEIIKKVNEDHFEHISTAFDDIYVNSMEHGLKNGLTVIHPSEEEYERWKEATAPNKQKYAEYLNGLGLPGTEAMAKIEELVDKYVHEFEDYHNELRGRVTSLIEQY